MNSALKEFTHIRTTKLVKFYDLNDCEHLVTPNTILLIVEDDGCIVQVGDHYISLQDDEFEVVAVCDTQNIHHFAS